MSAPRDLQPGDRLVLEGREELVLHRTVVRSGVVVTVARPGGSFTRLPALAHNAEIEIRRG